jgi:hypothetical protein
MRRWIWRVTLLLPLLGTGAIPAISAGCGSGDGTGPSCLGVNQSCASVILPCCPGLECVQGAADAVCFRP